jgi:hypothetical protein
LFGLNKSLDIDSAGLYKNKAERKKMSFPDEIRRIINSENAYYYSVRKHCLSSRLPSRAL